jgi:hypothetical protein
MGQQVGEAAGLAGAPGFNPGNQPNNEVHAALAADSDPGPAALNDNLGKKLYRVGEVTVSGAGQAIPGIGHAIAEDFAHPENMVAKVVGGAAVGAIMKAALPAGGVGKAIAGTVMIGYMLWDAAKPVGNAWGTAWHTDNQQKLDQAATNMGNGLGAWAWDSGLGMAGGKLGEVGTGWALNQGLGSEGLAAFESAKNTFYNKPEGTLGRYLVPLSEATDSMRGSLKSFFKPDPPPVERLTGDQAVAAVNEAAHHVHQQMFQTPVYKSRDFSGFMDGLTGEGPEVPVPTQSIPNLNDGNARVLAMMARPPKGLDVPIGPDVSPVPVDLADGEVAVRIPKGKGRTSTKAGGGTDAGEVTTGAGGDATAGDGKVGGKNAPPKTSIAQDLDPDNLKKLANEAAARQQKWAQTQEEVDQGLPSQAMLADFRDTSKAPIADISNPNRSGRMVAAEFDRSAQDLTSLIDQVNSAENLQEAGMIVQLHQQAAAQVLLGDRSVAKLNLLAAEMHGDLAGNMRRIGVVNNLLDGKVPSLVTLADDRGSGNFTIPAIDKVLHRPVTLFPRSQSELVDVFAPINYHENYGHDGLYPLISKFDPQYRSQVLATAVKETFAKHNIQDTDFTIGDKTMKKSELFTQMLIAQANENTADMIGTAKSGPGTPVSLGVLLQSLRRGGILETRNVYSAKFPETFEAHGFDKGREINSAQVMRQLGGTDPLVNEYADALDGYAQKASRPGDQYVYASMDNKGEKISFPQDEWHQVLKTIAGLQFTTELPALETATGRKTLTDITPGFTDMVHRVDGLATQIADAAWHGNDTIANFSADAFRQKYTIGNVFNASLMAWARATARGEEAGAALDNIAKISGKLTDLYLESNPHEVPLTPTVADKLRIAPLKTVVSGISGFTGDAINSTRFIPQVGARYTPYVAGATGSLLTNDWLLHRDATNLISQAREQQALQQQGQ